MSLAAPRVSPGPTAQTPASPERRAAASAAFARLLEQGDDDADTQSTGAQSPGAQSTGVQSTGTQATGAAHKVSTSKHEASGSVAPDARTGASAASANPSAQLVTPASPPPSAAAQAAAATAAAGQAQQASGASIPATAFSTTPATPSAGLAVGTGAMADTDAQDPSDVSAAGSPAADDLAATPTSSSNAAQPLLQAAADARATLVRAKSDPKASAATVDSASLQNADPASSGLAATAVSPDAAARQLAARAAPAQGKTAAVAGGSSTPAVKASAPAPTEAKADQVTAIALAGQDQAGGDPEGDEARGGGAEPGGGDLASDTTDPSGAAQLAAPGTALTSFAVQDAPTSGGGATPLSATAADLAAQMAAKVTTGSTRFELQLNPYGLGRVDVQVSIGADRQLTAKLNFADAETAHALSAHAGELKSALEQAGFTVPASGFDFTAQHALSAEPQGGGFNLGAGFGGFSQSNTGGHSASAAFSAGEALAAATSGAGAWTGAGDSRLDIRI